MPSSRHQTEGAVSEGAIRQEASRRQLPWLLLTLVALGIAALVYYFSWWFQQDRLASPVLVLLLLFALLYAGMQLVGNWLLYLFAYRYPWMSRKPVDLSVDVFVTACGEPYPLVEQALSAACALQGEHKTWLLDDAANPALKVMTERLGAGYLIRQDHANAKAGNLNAALARTNSEIVVIFDIDHVPRPDFLSRSLSAFADPQVGFVQVMLTFGNASESWVAQAAIETSLEFYNPTSRGADGLGAATLMGSNALIRREALDSIGGYQPGLAEDLATSIALHAAGWKSVYVAEPLAPGMAPPSFVAWFTQQLKWARGVFELLLTRFPRVFLHLTPGQRLSYTVRMTKYWIGPVVAAHLFATIAILIFAGPTLRAAFHQYLFHIAPVAIADVLIRHFALQHYRHPDVPHASLARAVSLVYATWPIYTLGWFMAVLRIPLRFKPTPKDNSQALSPLWLLPQALALALLTAGTLYTILIKQHPTSLLLSFAVVQATLQLIFLFRWMRSDFSPTTSRLLAGGNSPVLVQEVEFNHLPDVPYKPGYQQAFLLVRLDRQPVGQVTIDIRHGPVPAETLHTRILQSVELPFWRRWLQDQWGWNPSIDQSVSPATIAVCTRDRPADLRRCLEAISHLPDDDQEVLVVDSCSKGPETQQITSNFPKVRYLREEYPGLDRARNRAMLEAEHEWVAFIDDDARPDPGWLRALIRNFQEPRVACVSGLTMPAELDTPAQQWFERYSCFGRGFERRIFDRNSLHPLAAGHAGAGVNMALRRSAWRQVGPFDEALDAGTPTRSGGDTEMFSRLLAAGFSIVYDPAALSWHYHRRDWNGLRQTMLGYGSGTYAFWASKLLSGELSVFWMAVEWAWRQQLPNLLRSLLHPAGNIPADLLIAELLGCALGPFTYQFSRHQQNQRRKNGYQPYQTALTGKYRYPNPQPE